MNEETPLEELQNEPDAPVLPEIVEGESKEAEGEVKAEAPKVDEKVRAKERLSDRNRKLTFQAREAQREVERLRKENEEFKKQSLLKSEPDPDNYVDPEKHQEDKRKWQQQEEQRIREDERIRVKEEKQQERAQRQAQERSQKWVEAQKEALKSDPDYIRKEEKVIEKLKEHAEFIDASAAANVRDLINDTDNGTGIVAYLDGHPDELDEILDLSPIRQLKAISSIEKKVEAKTPKTVSSAPAPTRSERGGAPQNQHSVSGSRYKKNESLKERAARINGR